MGKFEIDLQRFGFKSLFLPLTLSQIETVQMPLFRFRGEFIEFIKVVLTLSTVYQFCAFDSVVT